MRLYASAARLWEVFDHGTYYLKVVEANLAYRDDLTGSTSTLMVSRTAVIGAKSAAGFVDHRLRFTFSPPV
jgi:hypothetical protein